MLVLFTVCHSLGNSLCSSSIKKLLRIARDRFRILEGQMHLMAGSPLELMPISVEVSDSRVDMVNTLYVTMSFYFPPILNHITCLDGCVTCIIIDWKMNIFGILNFCQFWSSISGYCTFQIFKWQHRSSRPAGMRFNSEKMNYFRSKIIDN